MFAQIDSDVLDDSNLNRFIGARPRQVQLPHHSVIIPERGVHPLFRVVRSIFRYRLIISQSYGPRLDSKPDDSMQNSAGGKRVTGRNCYGTVAIGCVRVTRFGPVLIA